ncbi:hypothetical protein [Vibrio parahaemolyticus]|uniref:hypothetical protein n=1 Tax=Vibrio parahaemolyticus TaxID=670 RepID=UPI00084A6823|nr:hypothetical protein [Vibrio parahaemolyticus]ODZ54684.1 hypothetical protein BBM41_01620 [Vibrio parahaemolyticus]ODZ68557.1 hypothetical protein BBM42_02560 [Vibrio parahaemolyticus]TOQ05368.1 hypothetical protein CGH04_21945 [Vibrio parahaemolyticus]
MNSHNKQFKQTLNARRFWFASGLVLPSNAESEPVRFGLLNWALALGWHQRLKVSVFIGFFSSQTVQEGFPTLGGLVLNLVKVFTVQMLRLGGWRWSPLNRALAFKGQIWIFTQK